MLSSEPRHIRGLFFFILSYLDTLRVTPYSLSMIKSFVHKGLQAFFEDGTKRGIAPERAAKLSRILDRLDASTGPQDMNLPGYGLHQLSGDRLGQWAVRINGNWRVTFVFEDRDAALVDYVDYH